MDRQTVATGRDGEAIPLKPCCECGRFPIFEREPLYNDVRIYCPHCFNTSPFRESQEDAAKLWNEEN